MPLIPKKSQTFPSYIEKHSILDLIIEPFLVKNFLSHEVFPYDAEDYFNLQPNHTNVLTFWEHYHKKYNERLKAIKILKSEYDAYWSQFDK